MPSADFDKLIDRRHSGSLKWDNADFLFGTDDVLPLWVADMDFPAPPPVLEAIRNRADHGVFGYPSLHFPAFDALAGWLKKRHGWQTDTSWMISTPGVVTAISVAIQTMTCPGDKIIIQPPVYPPFSSSVQRNGRLLVENPLILENGRYRMDFNNLSRKVAEARMLILCNPHNPVGRVWSMEELKTLADICLTNNVIILSDEIHGDLIYPGHRHIPLAILGEEIAKHTITCVAPSKTFNTAGLYTSAVIIPNPVLRKDFAEGIQTLSIGNSNIFGITAMEAAYLHGEPWLEQLLPYLKSNADYLHESISYKTPKIKLQAPEGTYLAWLDCRGLGLDPESLASFFAKEAKVGLNNGVSFGTQGVGFMRLNFGCAKSVLKEAIDRIAGAYTVRSF